MYALSDFCCFLLKKLYKFLKLTGLIVPTVVILLIISIDGLFLNFNSQYINFIKESEFILIDFSIIIFLCIVIKKFKLVYKKFTSNITRIKCKRITSRWKYISKDREYSNNIRILSLFTTKILFFYFSNWQ